MPFQDKKVNVKKRESWAPGNKDLRQEEMKVMNRVVLIWIPQWMPCRRQCMEIREGGLQKDKNGSGIDCIERKLHFWWRVKGSN